ncbi:MAG: ABC transporter permease [Clostridiales bacterium]|jgi:peptide/nickel transport system permease protein|nr:ABC transporter permease [Clostridiales bacterium]
MRKYITKRLIMLVPVLLGVSIIVFAVMRAFTADPAASILGQHATSAQIAELRNKLGLNDPIYVQYWNYFKGMIRGDLGTSLFTQTKVTDELLGRFPATAELAISAIIFASIFGVLVGVISAVKKNTALDYAGMFGALIGVSIPIFWLGIMLIILFGVILGWLPVSGRLDILMTPPKITGFLLIDTLITGNIDMFFDALAHLVLPTVALGMYSTAIIARMTRSSVLETLQQDYIRTAWAKGLAEKAVVIRHALRNALIPVATVIGLQLGSLLGGAVLTETVFAWPGIGKYTVDAITKSDYPVVQGAVLLVAFIFVTVNLVVDILYAFLDPRIKYS